MVLKKSEFDLVRFPGISGHFRLVLLYLRYERPEFLGFTNFGKAHQIKFCFFGEPPPRVGVSENVWFLQFKHVDRANMRLDLANTYI